MKGLWIVYFVHLIWWRHKMKAFCASLVTLTWRNCNRDKHLLLRLCVSLTHKSRNKIVPIWQATFFKCLFYAYNARISLKISLKFVPKVLINIIPALVQIMAWSRQRDKPLSEPIMVSLLTHICSTWPQLVKEWIEVRELYHCKFCTRASNLSQISSHIISRCKF